MKITTLMIAAAGSALIAGAAMAQDQTAPAPTTPDQSATAPAGQSTMPPAGDQSAPATTDTMASQPQGQTSTAPAGQYNYNGGAQPASSSTLGDPAMMKAGDPSVVTNGPVPDTRANRAKYGRPMSNAGKKSTPAGN